MESDWRIAYEWKDADFGIAFGLAANRRRIIQYGRVSAYREMRLLATSFENDGDRWMGVVIELSQLTEFRRACGLATCGSADRQTRCVAILP
jgi:hypothetical protein